MSNEVTKQVINVVDSEECVVMLKSMLAPLNYRSNHHHHLRSRFETFVKKLEKDPPGNRAAYKSVTYVDDVNYTLVDSYVMSMTTAMAFAAYVDPIRSVEFFRSVYSIKKENPDPYRVVSIPMKWVVSHFSQRKASSIFRTLILFC